MLRLLLIKLMLPLVCASPTTVQAGLQKEEPKASKAREAPPVQTLTPSERRQRLRERDQLEAEAKKLRAANKLAEAIAAGEKMLAIERQLFGDRNDAVVQSLQWLAELHMQCEDFTAVRT